MHKNNDKSLALKTVIEEGFYVMRFQNDSAEVIRETREMSSNYIQFHFCTKGHGDFLFNEGNYSFPVEEEKLYVDPRTISDRGDGALGSTGK